MQALTDRTILFIILALVVVTMVFIVFTKNENGQTKLGFPKFALGKKSGSKKENDNNVTD